MRKQDRQRQFRKLDDWLLALSNEHPVWFWLLAIGIAEASILFFLLVEGLLRWLLN